MRTCKKVPVNTPRHDWSAYRKIHYRIPILKFINFDFLCHLVANSPGRRASSESIGPIKPDRVDLVKVLSTVYGDGSLM